MTEQKGRLLKGKGLKKGEKGCSYNYIKCGKKMWREWRKGIDKGKMMGKNGIVEQIEQ